MQRGRLFYFRKRLPRSLSILQTNSVLSFSLRTDLPRDAKAPLNEALRAKLARILAEQDSMGGLSEDDADERIEQLESENKKLRRVARRVNFEGVQELFEKAGGMNSLALPDPLSPDLGRQATSLKRRIEDVESDVVEGDDGRAASRALLNDHGIEVFERFVRQPVRKRCADHTGLA